MSGNVAVVHRGVPLTAMLTFFGLLQLWGVVRGFFLWKKLVDHAQLGQGMVMAGVVISLATLVALVGVWLWRRLAVYAFALLAAVSVVITVSFDISARALLLQLVLLGALGWCIKQKWSAFR